MDKISLHDTPMVCHVRYCLLCSALSNRCRIRSSAMETSAFRMILRYKRGVAHMVRLRYCRKSRSQHGRFVAAFGVDPLGQICAVMVLWEAQRLLSGEDDSIGSGVGL